MCSTLGPLLFIISLNNLPNVLLNSKIALHADDTAIYYQSNDAHEIEKMLQEDLLLIYNWMKVNKPSLNIKKSKGMLFSARKRDDLATLNLTVGTEILEQLQILFIWF